MNDELLRRANEANKSIDEKNRGGLRGLLAGALPILGGAVGTVGGTLLGGPLGTVAGGAAGSGFGEFLRQQMLGEDASIETIGREALLGAVPGGLGMLAKGAKAAQAGTRAADTAVDTAEAAAKPSIIDRVKSGAGNARQEGFGLTVGQSKGGGRVLTPDDAARTEDFITTGAQRYGGIRAGKPIEQAKDAQGVFNNVTQQLDDTLASINRAVSPQEVSSLSGNITNRLAGNAMITRSTPTAEKLIAKIAEAPDLQTLEKIRREADNIAFTASGAKKTSAAAQAKEVRDAIDEFITPLSPAYKAVKGDYTMAKEALESTSKANKSAQGFPLPFTDGKVQLGKQAIPGIKNKIASKLAGQGAQPQNKTGGFRPFVKPAIQQAGTRAGASVMFGTPFVGQQAPDTVTASTPTEPAISPEMGAASQQPDRGQQLVQAAEQYLLETGDVKGAQTLMSLAEQFSSTKGGAEKPLSAEAARSVSTAQAGLEAISLLGNEIAKDPGVQQRNAIPGSALGGAVGSIMGTGQYENARGQIKDVIARLRTGAAITADEQKLFDSYVPQPFDSPEVVNQKLGILQRQFQRVAERSANSPTVDPSEVLSGAI